MEPMHLGFPKQHHTSSTCSAADLNSVGLWNNLNHREWSFEEKVCCNVAESREAGSLSLAEVKDQMCKEGSNNSASIIGLAVGGVAALIVVAGAFWCYKKKSASPPTSNIGGGEYSEEVLLSASIGTPGASAPPLSHNLPPPIAPSAYMQNAAYK